jgi:hypothetical protein
MVGRATIEALLRPNCTISHALSKLNLVELRPKGASYSLLAQAYRKRRSFRLLRCQRGHLPRGASGNGERSELLRLVVSARVGLPQQARPYQRRFVFAGRTHKILIMKGEEMKGEKSPLLSCSADFFSSFIYSPFIKSWIRIFLVFV